MSGIDCLFSRCCSVGASILLILTPGFSAFAQTADQPVQDAAPQVQPQSQPAPADDRIFKFIPNYLTVENASKVPPLTWGQKFKTVAQDDFDWGQFAFYGMLSGIGQARNSEPGFGQGAEGYAKRYGADFADSTIENFLTGAILPSFLRQDPRFYQLGKGSFFHRLGYAASRIAITRSDAGAREFNYSEVVGSAAGSAISIYSYHPRADRGVGNAAAVWGAQVGYDSMFQVIEEFWPDIRRKLFPDKSVVAKKH